MSKGMQITIAALTICAGGFWFLASGTQGEGTFAYYESVGDFVGKVDRPSGGSAMSGSSGRGARVHGFVVAGSIHKDLGAGHVDFSIQDDPEHHPEAQLLSVRLIGIEVPDLFDDGAEVVVEGNPGSEYFVARRVLAKCPSKYEPEDPAGESQDI